MAKFLKIKGANMDIDLASGPDEINWEQQECPWNKAENCKTHKCAVKNVSICEYFRGIEPDDYVICAYPDKE